MGVGCGVTRSKQSRAGTLYQWHKLPELNGSNNCYWTGRNPSTDSRGCGVYGDYQLRCPGHRQLAVHSGPSLYGHRHMVHDWVNEGLGMSSRVCVTG